MLATPLVLPLILVGFTGGPEPPPPRPAPAASYVLSPEVRRLGALPGLRPSGAAPIADATPEAQAVPAMPAEYVVQVVARSRIVYLLPPGPKLVREIQIWPEPGTEEAWRVAQLKLAWETIDPRQAAVDLPLGLLFGRVGAGDTLGETLLTGAGREVWSCRIPMPYRGDAIVEIRTERPRNGRVRVMTTPGIPYHAGHFWAADVAVPPTAATWVRGGPGHLVGLLLVGDRPPREPEGEAAPGWLLQRDSAPPAPLAGVLEPGAGTTVKDGQGGTVRVGGHEGTTEAAFRWRIAAPLPYDRSIRVMRTPVRARDDQHPTAAGPPATGTPRIILLGYEAMPSLAVRPSPPR